MSINKPHDDTTNKDESNIIAANIIVIKEGEALFIANNISCNNDDFIIVGANIRVSERRLRLLNVPQILASTTCNHQCSS